MMVDLTNQRVFKCVLAVRGVYEILSPRAKLCFFKSLSLSHHRFFFHSGQRRSLNYMPKIQSTFI
jgi:hypothetical protein